MSQESCQSPNPTLNISRERQYPKALGNRLSTSNGELSQRLTDVSRCSNRDTIAHLYRSDSFHMLGILMSYSESLMKQRSFWSQRTSSIWWQHRCGLTIIVQLEPRFDISLLRTYAARALKLPTLCTTVVKVSMLSAPTFHIQRHGYRQSFISN